MATAALQPARRLASRLHGNEEYPYPQRERSPAIGDRGGHVRCVMCEGVRCEGVMCDCVRCEGVIR